MRLQVIATGDMERLALAASIVRAFGDRPGRPDPGRPIERLETLRAQSVTATRLPPCTPEAVRAAAELRNPFGLMAFANKIVASAAASRRRHEARPDLLLVVDDLELTNRDQPEVVVDWLRWALEQCLASPSEADTRSWLREHCSFHLLVPMPEAYFFGDPRALATSGVPRHRRPHLAHEDLEGFETDDRDYLAGQPMRPARFHPKRYLAFLANGYSETRNGSRALASLDWGGLAPRHDPLGFARALFEDVTLALGDADNPLGLGPLAAPTWRVEAEDRVLRNI